MPSIWVIILFFGFMIFVTLLITIAVGWLFLIAMNLTDRLMIRSRERYWRRNRGKCMTCGYDLRATPERCPECGAIPARGNA